MTPGSLVKYQPVWIIKEKMKFHGEDFYFLGIIVDYNILNFKVFWMGGKIQEFKTMPMNINRFKVIQ